MSPPAVPGAAAATLSALLALSPAVPALAPLAAWAGRGVGPDQRSQAPLSPVVPTTGPSTGSAPGPASLPADRWTWPLDPTPRVRRPFDAPVQRWAPGHRGVDLVPTRGRTDVRAPADGVVAFAGVVAGRPVLSVDHPGGRRSSYEPVLALVPVGTKVARGTVVGRLDPSGTHCRAEAPCLHWGVRVAGEYVDPVTLLTTGPPVLLPLR